MRRLQTLTPACLSAFFIAFLAVGCASPGPPRPPSLKLPQPVTDLTAQRVGDQVLLRWTTPAKTTDGLPISGNLTARICRTSVPSAPAPRGGFALAPTLPGASASPCQSANRVAVHSGISTAADALPATLASNPITLLDYRVEIENAAGRTAGPSNAAFSAAGAAPPPVESLHATTISSGAMLEWAPSSTIEPAAALSRQSTFLDIDRLNPALVAPPRNSTKAKSSQPLNLAGQESAEVHLRSSGVATGTIDTTARFGQTYRYTAQRVVSIQLNGHPLEIRSSPSDSITLTLRDIFPPAIPTGVATVLTTTPQPGIDISWQPNVEVDLAGYNVYRRAVTVAGNQPIRLTPTPIPGSAYRDISATPGQRYAYSITAIDSNNNESKPSSEIEETLPQP